MPHTLTLNKVMVRSRVPFIVPNPCLVIGLKGVGEGYVARRLVPRQGPSVPQDATLSLDTAQTHTGPARHSRGPISSFVLKCAYAAFERAVEPLHSAISSFRPPNSSIPAKAGIQRGGEGCGNDARTLPPTNAPNFHTLVCRRPPAWAIVTKMMLPGFPSSFRRKPESRGGRGGRGGTNHTKSLPPTGASIFITWCAGGSRHGRLLRKHIPDSDPGCALQSTSMPAFHRRNVPNCRPMVDGGMRKCSAGACPPLGSGWGVAESAVPIRCTKPQLRLFIPWCAGASRDERSL